MDNPMTVSDGEGGWIELPPYNALRAKYASAVRTLQDIAAKFHGSAAAETAYQGLLDLGEPVEPQP
jgi:hypothetical protein